MTTYFVGGNNASVWSVPRVECTSMDLANVSLACPAEGITWTVGGANVRVTANGITAPAFVGDGTRVTTTHMSLANIQITDASFVPTGASALVSNATGYVVVNGGGFAGSMSAVIGGTILPSSLTKISATQIRLVIPALTTGTYPVWLFSDQFPDVRVSAIQVL